MSTDNQTMAHQHEQIIEAVNEAVNEADFSGVADILKNDVDGHLVNRSYKFKSNHESSLLHIACQKNCIFLLELLLEKNVDLNTKNSYGYNALQYLCTRPVFCSLDTVQLLLDKGANVNGPEEGFRNTPLFLAYSKNNVDLVELLLANGADPTLNSQCSLLLTACITKKYEIVKLLLKMPNSDINSQELGMLTPLHVACGWPDVKLLQILFNNSNDIDTTLKDDAGRTAFDVAKENKFDSIVTLLENYENTIIEDKFTVQI